MFSMTGYGKGEYKAEGIDMTVEIKTVNNRYLDIAVKSPKVFNAYEEVIRTAVRKKLTRGHADIYINLVDKREKPKNLYVDAPAAQSWVAAVQKLKELFPDKQIVLFTPIHRARAEFGPTNLQPDESWQNLCGEYFSAYVDAVNEAANVWGVPVIDLNSVCGMNPMVEAQQPYFRDPATDLLHPSDKGQRRLALTMVRQLMALPVF